MLTRAGSPLQKQPSPRPAYTVSPSAGRSMTPIAGTVLVLEGEERGVQRHAVCEGLRAVDRVHDPAAPAGAGDLGFLLTDDGVVGVGRRQPFPHEAFGGPVGRGHGRAVAFAIDGEIDGTEPLQRESTRLARQRDGLVEQRPIDGGCDHRRILAAIRHAVHHGVVTST